MAYNTHKNACMLKPARRYKYFILLNSSTKGPFYPSYMPYGWHWTHAFLERLQYGGGHGHYGSRMAPAVQNRTGRPYRNHEHVRPGGKPKRDNEESNLRLVPPGSYRPPSWPRTAPGLEPDGTWQPKGPPVIRAVGSSLVCLPESDAGGAALLWWWRRYDGDVPQPPNREAPVKVLHGPC